MLLMVGGLSGCAANALTQARAADDLRDYDVAVAQYMKELRQHPGNREAQLGLEKAKLQASDAHLLRGRRLTSQGRYDDAVVELQLASELNPTNSDAERELRAVRSALRTKLAAPAEGQTALESLLARTRDLPPAGNELPDTRLTGVIQTGRQATSRDVYLLIARMANLSVTFDSGFRETPAPVNLLSNMTVKQALDAVARSTNTFYQMTGPATIVVVPDTPAKRREYIDEVQRMFVVQNADLKETMDALRVVSDIRNVAPVSGTNMIVIKDTAERVQVAGRFLSAFDKARPEVVVDVEILEDDRTRLQEYGLQFASPSSPGIDGSAAVNETGLTAKSLQTLTSADVLISGLPALYYRLLRTDTNTRTLANPHIRMSDGIAATAEFGESVPVPTSVIAPLATGGVATQPITTYVYQNVGVNIGITPRTHANDEVTLALNVELKTAAGSGFGGLPTFGERHITTTIRLKDGETNILAGLLREDETVTRDGIPGLSDIPGIGHLFAKNHHERQQTDVVVMLTPHIVRVLDLAESDLRPLRLPHEGSGAIVIEGPAPPPPIIRGPGGADSAAPPADQPAVPGLHMGPWPVAPVPAPPPLRIIR
jgi:general secretion pathway protein D